MIIGPPPPGGGGSVSAVGTGCTTKGATTKMARRRAIGLDEYSITPPAEITRRRQPNRGQELRRGPARDRDHAGGDADDLPVVDGAVDIDALPNKVYRVMEFAGNTICEGTFDLPAGEYVVFSNLEGREGSDYELGMVATFEVS